MKTFSIIHASARPNKWRESYEDWMRNAAYPERIEYLLCVDVGGPFGAPPHPHVSQVVPEYPNVRLVWNNRRKCCVDAYNAGAAMSTGRILILNSDDFFTPPNWDLKLLSVVEAMDSEFVIEVFVTPRRLLSLQIMSRARYKKLGYALYPEYQSVRVDVEFTEHARMDGVVLNALHVPFRHAHPGMHGPGWDEVYAHENSLESYALGAELLERRRKSGFPPYIEGGL